MKQSFVKKSSNAFFENKKATVLNDISNIGGEVIKKGMSVIITGKNYRNKAFLDVSLENIIIYGVDPEDLELINESGSNWPVERDTLDLREHEFNFKK
jgi:hypothetical protein